MPNNVYNQLVIYCYLQFFLANYVLDSLETIAFLFP